MSAVIAEIQPLIIYVHCALTASICRREYGEKITQHGNVCRRKKTDDVAHAVDNSLVDTDISGVKYSNI